MSLLLLLAGIGGIAFAAADHTAGFVRYARVDRADGTYREMLIDETSLETLRAGGALGDGATILMESYYSPGEVGSVFVRRKEDGRWLYGSFRPGGSLPAVHPLPQCAACHRAAAATGGTFTLGMLRRFAVTLEVRKALCDRPGRAPCPPAVYAGE